MIPPRTVAVLLCLAGLLATGCGTERTAAQSKPKSGGAAAAAAASPSGGATAVSTDLSKKPVIPRAQGPAPTTLVKRDIVVGTGAPAKAGQTLSVQYVGVSRSTGKQFDASWDRGQPFSFPLGAGQVIPGWDQGLAGMKVGGRRELVIPSALAYGPQGSPPTIAPNEALIFVIDLKSAA